METQLRLMLMIDGDNAQASLAAQIIAEASKYGVLKIRRVYGDWSSPQLKPWKDTLHTHALKPEQQFPYTPHKNATDLALIIDAMDFINAEAVDGICIVSSDSDYTPLATRLREKDIFVMGIGRKNTPIAFVKACDRFIFTENLDTDADTSAESSTASIPNVTNTSSGSVIDTEPKDEEYLKSLLRKAYDATVQEDEWAHLGTLGHQLHQLDPAFDSRTYGHKLLSKLVEAHPEFLDVKIHPNGGHYVRVKGG